MFMKWREYILTGLKAGVALHKANPKMVAGFQALSAGQNGNGALDAKTKELIALAVSVTTRCDSCIGVHAEAARKAGVTEVELADGMGTAIALNAGAAYSYAMRTLEAYQQLGQDTN